MSQYNPQIHNRRSIRLKGYDYSQAGFYFVTIVCQNRVCLFGKIENKKMILNDPGKMMEKWYFELENKFPNIKCREMVVMPNHMHCIIEIVEMVEMVGAADVGSDVGSDVGADLCVRPNADPQIIDNPIAILGEPIPVLGEPIPVLGEPIPILGEHIGSPLHRVIQWYKTMATNEYIRGVKNLGWKRFDKKLLQRNYWEKIIRDERAYNNISNYILNNPANWGNDSFK